MPNFNIKNHLSPEENYQSGLLPQRNKKDLYYRQSSCRSRLANFSLSSENRRILSKTQHFSFQLLPLKNFTLTPAIQKEIILWTKKLDWNFPPSSIKTVFNKHIFNYLYLWQNANRQTVAYSLCYFSDSISHIAYVFYQPNLAHLNLPIRLTLQVIIDSQAKNLNFCYLGRFSRENGYYKRNMPGFETYDYQQHTWQPLNKID